MAPKNPHPARRPPHYHEQKGDRAWIVHPDLPGGRRPVRGPEARLAEAVGLAEAIDLEIVAAEILTVRRARPATLLGVGAVKDLKERLEAGEIDLVIVDSALTPVQQRNLERELGCKVIDRTGLILEIFGERARTREGRMQVERAALTFQRSRLVRSWTHLERQRGGFGFLGGPGESQLEADRRQIDERILRLDRDLARVARTRDLQRGARRRVPYPIVALVGYTNAGKSTLFNRLTGAEVVAADKLFATLDPTMRGVSLPSGRRVILSDTVGFISDLPTMLVAAFRATLEEVTEADLILHVRDCSHPDTEAQKKDVESVLRTLGIDVDARPGLIEVHNKIDRLDVAERAALSGRLARHDDGAMVSALTGEGSDSLLALLDLRLSEQRVRVRLAVPLSDGAALAWLHAHGEVIGSTDGETDRFLDMRLDPEDLERFERRFGYHPLDRGRDDLAHAAEA